VFTFFILARTSWTDIKFRKIYNRELVFFAICHFLFFHGNSLLDAAAVFFVFAFVRTISHGGLGFGDIKLLALLAGWWSSVQTFLVFVCCAFLLAGVFSLIYGIRLRGFNFSLPFAPFLMGAAMVGPLMLRK
jgi:Flp pilus assembly protein protease CpaA